MDNPKEIRIPKQTRSLQTKEKLLNTGKELFCTKGFYKTTANAISRKAGVSIGSFYAYFPDKEALFAELAERYMLKLRTVVEKCSHQLRQPNLDKRAWIRQVIISYLEVYENEAQFNREIAMLLCAGKPRIVALIGREQKAIQQMLATFFTLFGDNLKISNVYLSSIYFEKLLLCTSQTVVYGLENCSREDILSVGVDALYKYLTG